MRAVVLDTNVIVSAGLKLGSVPYRLVLNWVLSGHIQAYTSPAVVSEYRDVLWRPKFTRHGFPPFWIEDLLELSVRLPDPGPWPEPLSDPGDEVFLSLAHASGAWLVTGNLKHFPRAARRGVTVIAPADYLEKLGG
ncbi:MAG: putative toxin-antitoxin system toxin component, PIN family [Terracidiphilus sp.]